MFTLIGIGTGVAFVFSVIAMLFPYIFPAQFRTESRTVFVYFEATTVILTLVLLGQLLEARAHSRTSGAIKELLKLVPSEATLLIDGEEKIKVPTGTQTGTVFRIKGKGMPALGGRGHGDLFVSVSVVTPTSLTREQRKLLEQLAVVENKDLEDKGLVDKVRDIFG